MQRIEYVRHRLDRWAEWLAREIDGGRGGCISTIYTGRTVVQTSADAITVETGDPDAVQIQGLVVRLGQVDPDLQLAVFITHAPSSCRLRGQQGGGHRSLRANARRLGCSHTALGQRLARADLMLDGWLREGAAQTRERAPMAHVGTVRRLPAGAVAR